MDFINSDLRQRITAYHAEGAAWLQRLPDIIETFAERWQVALQPAFVPGGEASWTAPGTLPDGTEVVLKVGVPSPHLIDPGPALQAWDGRGVVRLLKYDADQLIWLLERCVPGDDATRLTTDECDDVAAAVLPALWSAPTSHLLHVPMLSANVQPRVELLRWRSKAALPEQADLFKLAAQLYEDLLDMSSVPQVLLHGDFHQRNLLRSTRGWLSIDPLPHRGDPAFDVANLLVHGIETEADPVERVIRMAKAVGTNPDRTRRWTAALLGQLCSWLLTSGQEDLASPYIAATHQLSGQRRVRS